MSDKILPIIFLAFANEREDGNAYLRNLAIEQRELRKILQKLEDDDRAEVEILFNVTINDIFDLFQHEKNRGRVAVFHFAGHANSFQLLLETEDGQNQSAHAEGLISFLGKQEGLKLAVLNGCSTEAQARDLALKGIATIATSNSIDDQVATDFAIRFYSGLANQAPLKTAFDEAQYFIITQKGTANMRDLYWDGIEEDAPSNKVPWELYAPEDWKNYPKWIINDAFERLNITLAEKARKTYLKAVELGKLDVLTIDRKTKTYIKNGKLKSALRYLSESFIDAETPHHQYITTLQKKLTSINKQKRRNLISEEEVEKVYSNLQQELVNLVG